MTRQPVNADSVLEPVVRAVVRDAGFELECLEKVGAGRRQLLRVVIDSDTGVGLDDIATVSRAVDRALDEHDLLVGPYTLEVTSPGVDRPLTHSRHWRRNRLRLVRATLADGERLVGRVGDCDDTGVTLLVSGVLRRVDYAKLDRAVVEVEFREPPAAEIAVLEAAGADGIGLDAVGFDAVGREGTERQDSAAQDVSGRDLEER